MSRRRYAAAGFATLVIVGGLLLIRLARCAPGNAEPTETPPGAPPRIIVDLKEWSFGVIDPTDRCEHTFVLTNAGGSPLLLGRGGTSCSCTMSDLPQDEVPPGGSVPIRVGSKIEGKHGPFSHTATIRSNDPNCPLLQLKIGGLVRTLLAADPPYLDLGSFRPGEVREATLTVYSQVWESFTMDNLSTSMRGATWTCEPADASELARLKALSGYRVRFRIQPELPDGDFGATFRLSAQPNSTRSGGAQGHPRGLTVSLTGEKLGVMSVSGAGLGSDRVLRLGAVVAGQPRRQRLTLVVRDAHRKLAVQSIRTSPPYLRVDLKPMAKAKSGLYQVSVEVPADAPLGIHKGDGAGTIRIVTDHPRVPNVELKVEFAVIAGEKS